MANATRITFIYLVFKMWNVITPYIVKYPQGETPLSEFPKVLAWDRRMGKSEAMKKTY